MPTDAEADRLRAEGAAAALRDAADAWRDNNVSYWVVEGWLRRRADEIEAGGA